MTPSVCYVTTYREQDTSTNAHRPTAWDAGCFAFWRPGGRTYRLDREEYGLREVVHDRIRGEHLVASIDTIA